MYFSFNASPLIGVDRAVWRGFARFRAIALGFAIVITPRDPVPRRSPVGHGRQDRPVIHLIRHSLRYVPRRTTRWSGLKPIYTAIDADTALLALELFEEKWGQQLPVIGQAWRDRWEYVIPFMAYEPEVRRVIYTTNAIEALNRQLRKALKTKGSFPSEDAARKLIYLAIQNAVPQWTKTRGWTKALLAFKIQFGDRLPN